MAAELWVLSVRQSFPTLSAYLPCFSCLCTFVNIILALTAWQNKYSIHPKMIVTFCNLDYFCMHTYYIPFHIAAIDIQFIGAQVFNSVFLQQNPAKAATQMQSRKKSKRNCIPFLHIVASYIPKQLGVVSCPPFTPLSRWQTSVPNCNVPCVGTRLGKHGINGINGQCLRGVK